MQMQSRPPFGLRMPEDLKDWVKETALRENRSANNLIVHLLNQAKAAAGIEFGDTAPAAKTDQDMTHQEGFQA